MFEQYSICAIFKILLLVGDSDYCAIEFSLFTLFNWKKNSLENIGVGFADLSFPK